MKHLKFLINILIILNLFSCKKTEKEIVPKIEIFLTENRIESYQGIEINIDNFDSLGLTRLTNRFDFNYIRFDTISSELIFAGAFEARKTDLKQIPILTNSEIETFNFSGGAIKLKVDGVDSLKRMSYDINGRQFALVIDDEIKLFGYFFPTIYPNWCNTFYYPYEQNVNWTELTLKYGKESRDVNLKYNATLK